MNCDSFMDQLDAYLDDEMSPAEARALEAHAASCASCGGTLAVARRLQRQAFALPITREPPRDLWPGIARRLEPRGQAARAERRWLRALAASVAAVVIFAGGMLANRVMQEGQTTMTRGVVEHLPSVAEARRILPASYVELIEGGTGEDRVATGTEQALLRNLLVVNLAIRETETAVAENPANADLRELLSGLYAQENRILAQAERLRATRQAPMRTTI